MAIGTPALLGTNFSKTASTTLTFTIPAGGVAAGTLLILGIGQTGSTNLSISTVTDTKSNAYVYAFTQNSASSIGTYCWYTYVTTALVSGDVITITFSASITAKTVMALTVTGTAPWTNLQCPTGQATGSALNVNSFHAGVNYNSQGAPGDLASTYCPEIWFTFVAQNAPAPITASAIAAGWTQIGGSPGTTGGSATTNVALLGFYRANVTTATPTAFSATSSSTAAFTSGEVAFATKIGAEIAGMQDAVPGGTTNTSIVLNNPNAVSGDILVAAIVTDTGWSVGNRMTGPSGWTAFLPPGSGSDLDQLWMWQKTAGGAEPTTYTWTFTTSGEVAGVIFPLRGVVGSLNYASAVASQANTIAPPALTTPANDSLIIEITSTQDSAANTQTNWPTNMANRLLAQGAFTNATMENVSIQRQQTAGVYTPSTFAKVGTSGVWDSVTLSVSGTAAAVALPPRRIQVAGQSVNRSASFFSRVPWREWLDGLIVPPQRTLA